VDSPLIGKRVKMADGVEGVVAAVANLGSIRSWSLLVLRDDGTIGGVEAESATAQES
jgi:hypothetical protein